MSENLKSPFEPLVEDDISNQQSENKQSDFIADVLNQIAIQTKNSNKDKQPDYIAYLLEFAGKLKFLRDSFQNYYAVIPDDKNEEVVHIDSKKFKKLLNKELRKRHGKLLGEKALIPVIWEISLLAEKTAKECEFIKRVASDNDALYIDRGTVPASYIKVEHGTGKKELVSTVPFIRRNFSSHVTLEFPLQSDGRQFERYFELMVLPDRLDQLLILTFLVSKLFYKDTTPILAISGPEDSGKSMLGESIKNIIDPSFELSNLPDKKSNLIQTFDHQFLPGMDNMSSISKEYSDLLCSMYTGVSSSKRVEFSVDDEHVYVVKNSGILVFIQLKNIPSDLLSRMFFIKRVQFGENGKGDKSLRKSLARMNPLLLDELLDLYVQVWNAREAENDVITRDRSKDFVAIGNIISRIVFNDDGLMNKLVERNIEYRSDLKVKTNEAVSGVIKFLSNMQGCQCTMTQMKDYLLTAGIYLSVNLQNPSTLAKNLNDGEDLLREKGITFKKGTKGNTNSVYTFVNHNYVAAKEKPKSAFNEIFPEFAVQLSSEADSADYESGQ